MATPMGAATADHPVVGDARPLVGDACRALGRVGVEVLGVDAEGLLVRLGAREATLGLSSLTRLLGLVSPAERMGRLAAWAQAVRAALEAVEPAGTAPLLPRLLAEPSPALWSRPLGPGLHLALALDRGGDLRLLSPFDLPRMGLSQAAAVEAAMVNLRARTPPPERAGLLRSWALGDGFDAARLLLAGRVEGSEVLVLAPARDLCAFCRVEDGPAGLAALRAWARDLGPLPWALTGTVWRIGSDPASLRPFTAAEA